MAARTVERLAFPRAVGSADWTAASKDVHLAGCWAESKAASWACSLWGGWSAESRVVQTAERTDAAKAACSVVSKVATKAVS